MRHSGKNALIWVVVLISLAFFYDFFQESLTGATSNYVFSDFLTEVERGQVASVMIQGNHIRGKLSDGSQFITYAPRYDNLVDKLHEQGVKVEALPNETRINSFLGLLLSWFPILLLIGVWVFFMRQMQGGSGGKALGFGKSKARLVSDKHNKTTFQDVAGIEEAKSSLAEIVEFLKSPQKFSRLGAKIPKGCLLIGPPGTGKTLLARAIAGEARVPFFSISGSDFVEMFVGVGASRVRDMFEQAKQQNTPCIIFIDEIDAVGRKRGEGFGSGGNDEREQTLNQLLTEMDGFKPNEGIVIIAATNRADVLDKALLRPGRFDRQIEVPLPDLRGREAILKVHLSKVKTAPSININMLARGTPGFSGADLANLVNEAALHAAMQPNSRVVTMQDCEQAKDKIMMGAERKSLLMSEEEKRLTAYHESGHALVSFYLAVPGSDVIYKATIIPRGRALGLVMRVPEADRFSVTREKLKLDLAICMGGRIAEEMIFGYDKVTTGASSDIKQATKIAKAMVTEWGMSDKVGPIFHGDSHEYYYKPNSTSDMTESIIDSEIKLILDTAYQLATKILTEHLDKLHLLASALLEHETLTGAEIKDLLEGRGIQKVSDVLGDKRAPSFPQAGEIEDIENLDPAQQ